MTAETEPPVNFEDNPADYLKWSLQRTVEERFTPIEEFAQERMQELQREQPESSPGTSRTRKSRCKPVTRSGTQDRGPAQHHPAAAFESTRPAASAGRSSSCSPSGFRSASRNCREASGWSKFGY
jgi:hypothetical protein